MDWFEDRGFYCVDNMPPALIANFIELTKSSKKQIEKAAFVSMRVAVLIFLT